MPRASRIPDRARRVLARADVRTAGIVSGVLLLAVFAVGVASYMHAAMEALEEADRWAAFALRVAEHELAEAGGGPIDADEILSQLPDRRAAVRIRDADGRLLLERGPWPPGNAAFPAHTGEPLRERRDLLSFRLLGRDRWLIGETTSAGGETLELAFPLSHHTREVDEVLRHLWVAGVVAAVPVLWIGLWAVALAFAPLRRATALLADVDAGSLGLRMPSRGTHDPIDRHAETLDRVLERIDAAFARLRAFSSDAAHELRTPLNRIGNVSEVALLGGGEREMRSALERIHRTTEELSGVVQALLLLAEIDDRRLALECGPIDVAAWIAHHVDAFAPSFEESGVKLAAHCAPAAIEGDRTLLDRVLANLLDNALAHAPAGSRVEVSGAPAAGEVVLCVDDAGRGVPERHRERIFDRFARIDGKAGTGYGLGLALARAIAELHGGSLRVGSSPAGGARFELRLPADGAPARQRGAGGSSISTRSSSLTQMR